MDSSFWSGFSLTNFLFKHVHITSPLELFAVCVVTAAIAFTFEGTRTLRDWLYMEFLKKRRCHAASTNDASMVLREVKNGTYRSSSAQNDTHSKVQRAPSGENQAETNTSIGSRSGAPVIATGTVSGSGKSCKKPSFHVGFIELSCSTVLHMCQVFLGYILMLVVMTFNVWIFLSVLLGTTIGFFVFDGFNKKIHALKANASISK